MKIKKVDLVDFIFIFLCFVSCIEPVYITNIVFFNVIFAVMKIVAIIILLLKKQMKLNFNDFAVVLFILVAILSNLSNGFSIILTIGRYISWILITFLIDVYMKNKSKKFIKYSSIIFSGLIIINFFSILNNPVNYFDNITRTHFLGFDNDNVPVLLLGIYFNILDLIVYNKKSFLCIISIITTIISLILVWSANGIIGLIMIVFYIIFLDKNDKRFNRVLNLKNYFIVAIIFFVLIVLFRIQDNFTWFIEDVLHRDLTFTGRIYIWDDALKNINNNKLLGVGIYDFSSRLLETGVYHAHCTFLNVIFENGILGSIAYFMIHILAIKSSYKFKNNRLIYLTAYFIFIFLIITLSEFYVKDIMFITLIGMNYNLSKLIKEGDEIG